MPKPSRKWKSLEFTVVIERGEDGYYVASLPALPSCHTQAHALEDLATRIREVVTLCLVEQKPARMKFVHLDQVEVSP